MIGNVLAEIRDFQPGDWSPSDVAIGANLVRWRPAGVVEDGETRRWLETSRPDVRGTLVDAPEEVAPPGVSVAAIDFTIPTDDPFPQVAEEMAGLFGPPPTIVSGPRLRWYGTSGTVRAELTRGVVAGEVQVRLEQLPWAEDDEVSSLRFGSVLSPPYLWRADDRGLIPKGLQVEGGLLAASFSEFTYQFPYVLDSFREGVALLPHHLPTVVWAISRVDEPATFVQGWFAPDACRLEVGADRQDHPPTRAAAAVVVERALAAIDSWGVEDPEQVQARVFVPGSPRSVTTPGLGLPRG